MWPEWLNDASVSVRTAKSMNKLFYNIANGNTGNVRQNPPKNRIMNWLQVTVHAISALDKIMMHARATEFDWVNLLAIL